MGLYFQFPEKETMAHKSAIMPSKCRRHYHHHHHKNRWVSFGTGSS